MRWKNRDHFRDRLIKRGFTQIGSGLYSNVYAKPGSDQVIKIAGSDDEWPAYIAWALTNQYLGTFAPNVKMFRVFTGADDDKFYVAVMERLDCTLEDTKSLVARITHNNLTHVKNFARRFREPEETPIEWRFFIKGIEALKISGEFHWDLHSGNFMTKGDRLVLIDPFGSLDSARNTHKIASDTAALFNRRKAA